jgi:flagellar biosynthesis protein FliQ
VSVEVIIGIGRETIEVMMMLAGPVLAAGLIAGVLVSLFQAVTRIQDMTLSLVPKMLAVVASLALFGPWMLERLLGFTTSLIQGLPSCVR